MHVTQHSATLIYDGDCPFCKRCVDWIAHRARPGALEFLPCQAPSRPERFPQVTEAACMEGMQLVMPGGQVRAGETALPDLFRMMRRWRWLAFVFELPVVRWVSPYAYRWTARHRYMISEFVRRKAPSSGECGPDAKCGR